MCSIRLLNSRQAVDLHRSREVYSKQTESKMIDQIHRRQVAVKVKIQFKQIDS